MIDHNYDGVIFSNFLVFLFNFVSHVYIFSVQYIDFVDLTHFVDGP